MPEKLPLTDVDYALIQRLLDEYDIDAAHRYPERLERLVLAMAPKPVGMPYGAAKDFFVLFGISDQLAKLTGRGVAPSVRAAARNLAKKPLAKFWGMTAGAILKRENEMLRRLRPGGKGLQPELKILLQKRLDWLADEARQQAKQGEK